MTNRRPSQFSRLLHHLRDLVSVDPVEGVLRRDLASPNQCEVQLELDLGRSAWKGQGGVVAQDRPRPRR